MLSNVQSSKLANKKKQGLDNLGKSLLSQKKKKGYHLDILSPSVARLKFLAACDRATRLDRESGDVTGEDTRVSRKSIARR